MRPVADALPLKLSVDVPRGTEALVAPPTSDFASPHVTRAGKAVAMQSTRPGEVDSIRVGPGKHRFVIQERP